MRFDRSRSFKVIDFYKYWKPVYDFVLMINCDLSSISHHFQDIAAVTEVENHPQPRGLAFRRQTKLPC